MKYIYLSLLTTFSLFSSCQNKTDSLKQSTDSREKIIKSQEINSAIAEGRPISIQNATIVGDIDFTSAKESVEESPATYRHFVNSPFLLVNCTIKGKIIGFKSTKTQVDFCTFTKNLTILGSTVQDSLIFRESDFQQLVDIRSSDIEKPLVFIGARFLFKKNYFSENRFFDDAQFNLTVFEGEAIFFRTKFSKHIIFQGSIFSKTAQFGACQFNEAADFSLVRADGGMFFNYAEFTKHSVFSNSKFNDRFEFLSCKINTDIDFKNCSFYGSVKYNKSEVKGVLSFDNSFFHQNSPDFSEIILSEKSNITAKDALVLKNEPVVISGLKNEKK
jgi:hypothetical protein